MLYEIRKELEDFYAPSNIKLKKLLLDYANDENQFSIINSQYNPSWL